MPSFDTNKTDVAVIGSGSWGTALAVLLARKGCSVRLWGRRDELVESIVRDKENRRYLPGVSVPENVVPTTSLIDAVSQANAVVLAIPSTAVREIAASINGALTSEQLLIHAGKGLESETGLRGSEVITQELGENIGKGCVALSGPNLAVELAHDIPTATVVASCDIERAVCAQKLMSAPCFRVYRNPDIVGVELGGALKNVLAIGAGISDGLGYGDNTKATVVTRGLVEMTRLGRILGAEPLTFTGLSGFGDLMATSASRLSRNLRLGVMLGEGLSLDKALTSLGQVAEGVHTCEAAYLLSRRHNLYMPITEQLHAVLFNGKLPEKAVFDLMSGEQKEELA